MWLQFGRRFSGQEPQAHQARDDEHSATWLRNARLGQALHEAAAALLLILRSLYQLL